MSEPPTIPARDGLLAYLVGRSRPALAEAIATSGCIETAVIGLGRQGRRHAGLMRDFGTSITAAVDADGELQRLHETIPVYPSITRMLESHPAIAAVSIWRHFSTAARAALEAIAAGIPIVVLISEGIARRDMRDVLAAARRSNTLLLGPNTPGIIFPPERVKIGMLPDVFYPAEPQPGQVSARGVTICSRSGAILYHMSDALASAGIAQNGVIGVGGDAFVGSPFPDLVPLVMGFDKTDLVVVAGEIGGSQEERLAADKLAHPERYPKPIVALLSGRCAPAGKTMGHAGAIVSPGVAYGTFATKKAALESAGITVVNSQLELIEAVTTALDGQRYFDSERYYERMQTLWEAEPADATWNTAITRVEANNLQIRGEPLARLVEQASLLDCTSLCVTGRHLAPGAVTELDQLAVEAADGLPGGLPTPRGDLSKQLAGMLLVDPGCCALDGELQRTVWTLGRVTACLAQLFGHSLNGAMTLSQLLVRALAGESAEPALARLIEAAVVACVDHGVTPPSAQASILAASVRADYAVAIASGIGAITDVHGGAGARAAEFFTRCVDYAGAEGLPQDLAVERVIAHQTRSGQRIEGLGHRIHTLDPRRDVLWRLAESSGIAGPALEASRLVESAFRRVRGMTLPVNVDGVIGAIVAEIGLDPQVAKAIFILGRIVGLSAHYFEERSTQPPMRRIDFSRAVYSGPSDQL